MKIQNVGIVIGIIVVIWFVFGAAIKNIIRLVIPFKANEVHL